MAEYPRLNRSPFFKTFTAHRIGNVERRMQHPLQRGVPNNASEPGNLQHYPMLGGILTPGELSRLHQQSMPANRQPVASNTLRPMQQPNIHMRSPIRHGTHPAAHNMMQPIQQMTHPMHQNIIPQPILPEQPVSISASGPASTPASPIPETLPPQTAAERFRQVNRGLPDGVQFEPLDEETKAILRKMGKLSEVPANPHTTVIPSMPNNPSVAAIPPTFTNPSIAATPPIPITSPHPLHHEPTTAQSVKAAPGQFPSLPSGAVPTQLPSLPSGAVPVQLPAPPSGAIPAQLPALPPGAIPSQLPSLSSRAIPAQLPALPPGFIPTQAAPPQNPETLSQGAVPTPSSESAVLLERLIQDDRNASVYYQHLSEIAPAGDFQDTLHSIARECEGRQNQYQQIMQNLHDRTFEPNQNTVNTSVDFDQGVEMAVIEERKILESMAELIEQLNDKASADVLQNLLNKRMIRLNWLQWAMFRIRQ